MKLFVFLTAYLDKESNRYENNQWLGTNREKDHIEATRISFEPRSHELYVTVDNEHAGLEHVLEYNFMEDGTIIKDTFKNSDEITVVIDTTKLSVFTLTSKFTKVDKEPEVNVFIATKSWLKKIGILRAHETINQCLGLKPISDDFELLDQPICNLCIRDTCIECPIIK